MFTARNLSPLPERDRNGLTVVFCAPHVLRYFTGEPRGGRLKTNRNTALQHCAIDVCPVDWEAALLIGGAVAGVISGTANASLTKLPFSRYCC